MVNSGSPVTLYFGVFALDAESGELRKSGLRVKLGDRELQVLLALLESPGTTVTREDLRHRLWRDHTIVDFENNLNNAISRLRRVLSDSSQSPRFIETVPRHGYRFVAPVTQAEKAAPARPSWWRSRAVLVSVVVVVLGAASVLFRSLAERTAHIKSLAVLPFSQNMTSKVTPGDLDSAVTAAIITNLKTIHTLRVVPLEAALRYAHSKEPVAAIARKLNVEAVAEGSVHPEGDEFQVNLRLIRGENGALIWSGSFRERTSDFPRLARDVASGIIQAAGLHLTQQQSEELAAQPGTDPQAREDYLKGRYYMGQLTESSRTKALSYFEQAVAIAPDFAPAYVGMVDFYEITDTIPPRIAIPKTKFYALKALRLNPGLSSAHTALAVARFYQDWDWEGSQREFRRALELDPGSERAHRMYALMLSCTGRVQEAINQIHQAHQLDPLSIPVYDMASMTWLNAHQFDQSIQQAEQLLELNPNSVSGHVNLGAADLFEGRFPRAIEEFKTAAADGGDGALMAALLGPAYARWGKWRLAEEQLTSLKRWSKRRYVPPIWFAMVDASLGADRKALDSLERDFRDRDSYMAFLKVTPWFDSLRDEPRFHKLIQQMNFPG